MWSFGTFQCTGYVASTTEFLFDINVCILVLPHPLSAMGILLMRKSCFKKVLLFGGPYNPNVPFELEVLMNEDFNDWNLWQRKGASNWRCPLRFRAPKHGYHIMAIKYTTLNAAIILQLAC